VIPDTSKLKRLATIVGLPDVTAIHPSLAEARQEAAERPPGQAAAPPASGRTTSG
jgi:hypothetical protein